jgi:GDP-L-fucose synthase
VELLDVAEMVRSRSGKDIPIIVGEQGLGPEYSGDNSRLRGEIPEIAFTPINEAIDRMYSWYEENIQMIDREKLLVDK